MRRPSTCASFILKGMKWKIPDYKGEELAYEMANDQFIKSGRKILDATKNGKLQIFPKIDFDSLFID